MTEQQHPKKLPPFPPSTVYAAKALATPVPEKAPTIPEQPRYTWLYFFADGGVTKLTEAKHDAILFDQAYLVMVSVPGRQNQAPYVEIVKSTRGSAAVIMTADVPVGQPESGGCGNG